jgi:phenylacetate-coenzyme A ligase PaaK-like adenylate-forming protein
MNILSYLNFQQIRRNQWRSGEELEKIQSLKLQKMIQYAYNNVPYYHDLLDSVNVKPDDIQSKADLYLLPITSRSILQETPPDKLISKKINRQHLKKITTSGSSGSPLTVYLRQKEFDKNNLLWARASQANGQRLFGKAAYLKYSPSPTFWFEKLGIWKKIIIPIKDEIDQKVSNLRRINPEIIKGNPFELLLLAQNILDKKIKDITPASIFSMGSLLDEDARSLLQKAFQSEIFDYYAATETGLIAWECSEHKGYHINLDAIVVEIIHKGQQALPNEAGRIICTNLNSHSMPFIRYDLGDIGTMASESCSCGRGLPLLKSIEGRADDFFIDGDGKSHSPSNIVNRMKTIGGIKKFKLIQTDADRIKAQIVITEDLSVHTISQQIQSVLRTVLGEKLEIEIDLKDEIPRDPERKIRSMISYVTKEF